MTVIVDKIPTTKVPGVFYQAAKAQNQPALLPTDTVGFAGLAQRGPFNTPFYVTSKANFKATFGGVKASVPDPATPLMGYLDYLAIADQNVENIVFVRVGDATGATAYVHLVSGGATKIIALHAASPGTWAGSLLYATAPGNIANTFNLTLSNSATTETETLFNLPTNDPNALVTIINANATLVVASLPVADTPTQPAFTVAGVDGTISQGAYYGLITYTNVAQNGLPGETCSSPESAQFTVAATNHITITIALPTGATGAKLYLTAPNGARGTETYAKDLVAGVNNITTITTGSSVTPPAMNTATVGGSATVPDNTNGLVGFPSAAAPGKGAGFDGDRASTLAHIGAPGAPSTGLYALGGLNPKPNLVFLSGAAGGDTLGWGPLAQSGADNGWICLATLPQGTTDVAAVAAMNGQVGVTSGPNGQYLKVLTPWIVVDETEYYAAEKKISPLGFAAGITAAQPANTSSGNKSLAGAKRPEFAYSDGQVTNLTNANINAFGVVPIGGYGFRSDYMADGSNGFELRMQLLFALQFLRLGARYLQVPIDAPLFQQAHDDCLHWLNSLADKNLIPKNPVGVTAQAATATTAGAAQGTPPSSQAATVLNYAVLCDGTINPPGSDQFLIQVQCRLFQNSRIVVFQSEVGASVTVTLKAA